MNANANPTVHAPPPFSSGRTLVLAAHPDDETVGAGGLLSILPDVHVVHLTRGVPRRRALWSDPTLPTAEHYAALRRNEAASALAFAGIPTKRIHQLDGVDQGSVEDAVQLTKRFVDLLRMLAPSILMTHAYEGGHPDHDCAALVAHLALRTLERMGLPTPRLFEMTAYHGLDGSRVTGSFLEKPQTLTVVHVLPRPVLETKRRMFEEYRSQAAVLSLFSLGPERFRRAPAYRFDRAPHPGTLWFEREGWMDGPRWRAYARYALRSFGLPEEAWL